MMMMIDDRRSLSFIFIVIAFNLHIASHVPLSNRLFDPEPPAPNLHAL
jgi:hypothetical protein